MLNMTEQLRISPVKYKFISDWASCSVSPSSLLELLIYKVKAALRKFCIISFFQRTANALRALSRMGSLGGLMAGAGKGGGAAGAAAPKPGGFLQKVKEEKAKEEAQEKPSKPEPKKEAPKEEPKKTPGDNLVPERRRPNLSGRRSPALSGRRSPMSRAEVRKYSTPDPCVERVQPYV